MILNITLFKAGNNTTPHHHLTQIINSHQHKNFNLKPDQIWAITYRYYILFPVTTKQVELIDEQVVTLDGLYTVEVCADVHSVYQELYAVGKSVSELHIQELPVWG